MYTTITLVHLAYIKMSGVPLCVPCWWELTSSKRCCPGITGLSGRTIMLQMAGFRIYPQDVWKCMLRGIVVLYIWHFVGNWHIHTRVMMQHWTWLGALYTYVHPMMQSDACMNHPQVRVTIPHTLPRAEEVCGWVQSLQFLSPLRLQCQQPQTSNDLISCYSIYNVE